MDLSKTQSSLHNNIRNQFPINLGERLLGLGMNLVQVRGFHSSSSNVQSRFSRVSPPAFALCLLIFFELPRVLPRHCSFGQNCGTIDIYSPFLLELLLCICMLTLFFKSLIFVTFISPLRIVSHQWRYIVVTVQFQIIVSPAY